MNDAIITALTKLIDTGGSYAIWGIFTYYGMGLLKVGLIGSILVKITESIFKGYASIKTK